MVFLENSKVSIQRYALLDSSDDLSVELYRFCDSSIHLYCAVLFFQVVMRNEVPLFFGHRRRRRFL